jgi:hypothetical protein
MSSCGTKLTRKMFNLVSTSLTGTMMFLLSAVFAYAQPTVNPASVTLALTPVNTTSAVSQVTLANKQATALTITGISASANFAVSGTNCPLSPNTLGPNLSCTISLTVTPTQTGDVFGTLTITDNASNSPSVVALAGAGSTGGSTTVTPPYLQYSSFVSGQTSPAQLLTFTNNGASAITVSPLQITGDFAVSSTTCSTSLAASASCKIYVTFTPTAVGARTGVLSITDSGDAAPVQVYLTGTGLAPVGVSPSALAFGPVATGATSAIQYATVTNNQATALTITQISSPGSGFAASAAACGTLPITVAGGKTCKIAVMFTPSGLGAQSASLTITDSASNSPQTVALTGTGVAPTTLSPTSVAFGSVSVNTTSPLRVVTFKNNQPTALTINSLAVTAGSPFAIDPSSTCLTPTVAAGASCTIALSFSPTSVTALSSTLTITDTASNSPQTAPLTGTGLVPVTVSPASIAFGSEVINTISPTRTILLHNNQASALTISSILFSGPFALSTNPSVTTCPAPGGTVAAGATCALGVTFDPLVTGNPSGQITIVDSAANSPQVVTFTGGASLATGFNASSLGFGNVALNATSPAQSFKLLNFQTVPLNISSVTAPAPYALVPASTTCVAGTPIPAGGSCTISVTFTPTTLGAQAPASVTIVDDAATSPQTMPLGGTGITPVVLTPSSLNFYTVVTNVPKVDDVTLRNNQNVPLTISSIGFTGNYKLDTSSTCPVSPNVLAAGASCVIGVSLDATTSGLNPGTMTVSYNGPGSPQVVNMSGTSVTPVLLSPTSLTFPSQFEGITSAAKTVTLTNQQGIPLNIASVTVTGANSSDFALTTNCPTAPSSLPASSHCTLSLTFTPSGVGNRNAMVSIVGDAPGSPQSFALTGPGNAPVYLVPTSITNFTAPVASTSAYKTISIANTDPAVPLHISSFQSNGDFVETSTTCPMAPAALAGGATCYVTVSFAPTIGGTRGGQLLVYDDAVTSPQVVSLSGVGTNPLTLSTGSLTYSAQKTGTPSPTKNIMLVNHESQSESFTLTPAGDFIASSNCTTGVIAAKSSCVLSINFVPTATGPRSGSLTIADSAAIGSPLIVSLLGSGTTTNPPAAVFVVAPGAGTVGTTVNAVITGNGWTNFSAASVVSFDPPSGTIPSGIAVTVPAPATTTANTINAQFVIGAGAIPGARNIRVVTPLSGGGTETALLTAAFIIADSTNSHTITTVNPNFGIQGQNLNVNLTATGTNFVQGVTFANFGDGITINSLTVNSPTTAQANITISNTTYIGYRTITLVTGGEVATSGPQAFQIGPNAATLISVTPNSSPQGTNLAVALVATGTHFLQNATVASFGSGINVGDIQVTSPTTATANIAVTAGAPVGVQNVTVSTGGEIATLANAFTVTGSTPYLVSVLPSSGQQGQTLNVEIKGQYTTFNASNILADFGGDITVNSYNVISPTDVVINITVSTEAAVTSRTANLTSGPAGGATIFPFTFTVTASSAAIVSVTPSSVPQGGQVVLTVVGSNTHWVQGTTTSAFTPIPVGNISVDKIVVTDSTHATLNISVSSDHPVGGHSFYMATGGEVVYSSISVYANTPTLSMTPANGMPGQTESVSFTGQFTHFSASTLPVVSGQGVSLQNFIVNSLVSAQAKIVILPGAAPGLRTITFTTGGEIVTTYFNVTVTPVYLLNITPYHSPQNNTLNVEITGANTHFTAGTTVVNFDPFITVNSTQVNTATDLVSNITVAANAFIGWHTAYVNTGSEQVIIGFYVDGPQAPTLVSVNPSSAAQGATANVTITGSLTNWVQGQTEAILGAGVTVANFTVTSPTTATATISVSPTAPVGGNSVILITGPEIVSGAGFSVTPNSAEITVVAPSCTAQTNFNVAGLPGCGSAASGVWVVSQLQTVNLSITGVGTHWLEGETTASFGPGVVTDSLVVTSPTTANVQITVLSSAPVGFAPLTMQTDGEVVTLQQAIDIEEGFPTLLSTSPGGAEQGVTLNLQVLGRFTHWQQGVTSAAFNQDIAVNSFTVIDSDSAIANITVSPLAYVDIVCNPSGHTITITTGSEQVSLPGTFCVARGPAQVTNVNPSSGVQGSTETVTITGSATHFIQGETTASFGSGINVGNVTVTSPTTATVAIAVTTAAPTGYTSVTMSTLGEVATQQFAYQVSPGVATLNEAIPNQAEQGAPLAGQPTLNIHLIGQYSHFSGLSTATFGAGIVVNSVTYTDPTDLTVNITIDPLSYVGGRTVTVTTPGVSCAILDADITGNQCAPGATTGSEIVSAGVFSIIQGPAIITQVAPATGNQGQEIVFNITGSGTHWAQNITQFWIPGAGSDVTINAVIINSPTSATVDLSISPTAGTGTRSVYMVTAGEALTDSGAFVVTGGIPVITYLTPNNAQPGTNTLDVTIHGLYTNWDATTTVNFGPGITVSTFQVENSTTINAVINIDPAATVGYRTVFVRTGTQGLTSNFQVYVQPPPVPYISYFWPSSGLPGQTFTVSFTGSNTHWDPATTTPTFGDGITINTFQVTSPTSAIANITIDPATYAGSRLFTLTTGTEVDSVGFSVVISVPTLSVVDPGSGLQGATNLEVNIIGQYTLFDNTTVFNFGPGVTVNSTIIRGATIATVTVSIDQLAQLGGRAVTATTGGTTVGGAGFSVTPSLALISAISPNTALQGSTIMVEVTGQNTHWSPATTFQFGAGIVVATAVVNSPTDATLTLTLPALAPIGPTGASAHTLGEVANITNGFVVQPGTPLLLSSGPGSAPQQSTATFTILSQATQWTVNTPTVSFGNGVTLTNVIVTGDTSLTVDGYVQPTTNVGYRNLTVSTGTQVLTLPNAMYVSAGPAVINSVSPSTGGQGANIATLAIVGTNTHWQSGVTTLTFPGVLVNSLVINSPTSATANITVSDYANPGLVTIMMTTLGETAVESNAFEITQTQPEMLYINSATAIQGVTKTVTITGLYTHLGATTTASFGTGVVVNSVTAASTTSLQVNITVQPTTAVGFRNVSITTGTEVVASSTLFQVTTGPAAILSLNPAQGGEGSTATVLVTGSQTNFAGGITTAAFGGGISVTGLSVVDALHANVSISIPNSTPVGNYNATLTTGGEVATILSGFSVTTGNASIAKVNPPTGHQGDVNLNVALTGLFSNWINTTSVANFGAGITVNTLTVSDATDAVAQITISPTAAIGSRTVTVTTSGQVATIVGGFFVLAGTPSLTSAIPGSAQAGATVNVVIDGAFTSFVQGTSTVSFGSGVTVNTITVSSATQLTANITVATNASVGNRDVNVTTGAQSVTLSNGFAVLPGTPVVTQINPNIGTPNATVSVTIYGQYTNWVNGTTKVSFGPGIAVGGAAEGAAGPVTVSNATTLTASLNIDTAAALGPRDVIITTGGEMETVAAGYTVQPTTVSPPTVISLSPGAYSGGMPINSSIIAVFSQPMGRPTITASNVLLYLSSNPNQGFTPVAGTVILDASGRVVTFTPSAALAVNSTYYFQMTNAVQDASGNSLGNYEVYLYTIFGANTAAPTVIAANPPANTATVGTNASIQLEFSADMDQATQAGLTVSTGGNPIAGTYSWNASPTCSCGPGTILTFTPSAALTPGATYTVAYAASLTDTAGNALTPGSFTFTAGTGPDTANNSTYVDYSYFQQNIGTNFVPRINFAKPINPLDINTGTLYLYNYDTGKYILGSVNVAANGLSATFTPTMPLLPNDAYDFHMSSGNYDMDGVYLSGSDNYFVTGTGSATTTPSVASIYPANSATSVPLNAQIVVHFSEPIDSATIANAITVTPSGGSAINGTATLASDEVTLTFVPAATLAATKVFTVHVSGYKDLVGNAGATFTSTFTTSASVTPLNLSTGFTSGGTLSTVDNTPDANWTVTVGANPPVAAEVVGPGDTGWYSGWQANGPKSSWITLNPNSITGNTFGTYATTFNLTGYSLTNLCFVGAMGIDDNGTLLLNGTAITGNINAQSLTPLNISLPTGILNAGVNTLSLQWGSTDNYYEAFRLQGTIQTCGASLTGGLSLVSSSPTASATNVPTNSTITLNFNNPLDPATVNDTTLPVMIGWNSNEIVAGSWAVSGTQAIFTPDAPFPPSAQIYVGNCNGPYDTAGDTWSGCYSIQLLTFNTSSTVTAPSAPFQVTAFSPASGATNVGQRAQVTATFNRSFNPGTINQNNANADFALYAGDGLFCQSYNRSTDNSSLQFNCYALPSSTKMTALINSNLQDMAGNGVANFTSRFTTAPYDANTHGSIITTRPGNGATGIGVNSPIVLYSNLPINPSTANAGIQVAQNNVALNGTVQVLDNGYTLEFTPSSPLTSGALVQWWITGSLVDAQYGSSFNATNGYFFVAASLATATPTITASSPAFYTNPTALNAAFDFQFNTPLDPATVTTSNIYLYDSHTGLNVPATYSMPQPNEVRIVPTSDVSPSAYIYLYVTANLHSSTSVPAQATNPYFYTGTTDDTTLPTVVSSVPFNGAGNVGVNVTPGVVVSKAVDPVSVNSTTFQVTNAGTPLAGTYYIDNTDTRISFIPNSPLPASTHLKMTFNGVTDVVGHPVTFTSNFVTAAGPDFQAPTVVSTSISSNQSVPINSSITIQFSESMDITTFNSGNLHIYDYLLGTVIPTTLTWSADQSVAYLTPVSPLAAGRQYNLYIASGTDLAGNQLSGVSFTFYGALTSSGVAPAVVHVNPLDAATGVGVNTLIEAQFSAAIDPTTLTGVTLTTGGNPVANTPSLSAGNTVLQLVPAVPLTANTNYLFTIAGVKDPAGNTVATISYSFTTGASFDLNAPSVVNYNPPYNSTVGTNVIPKFVFNKPLNPITVNTGTIRLFLNNTGQYIPATVTSSANGLEATLQPQIPLLPGSQYHFQACCGFQDFDGNNGNQIDVYFYTGAGPDTTAPTVTISPVTGAVGTPLNAQVLVSVNKPIDPTSWSQSTVQLLDNLSNPVAGTVAEPNSQAFTFVPTSPLSAGITYTVKVSQFTDAMGNAVTPVSSTFTTGAAASTPGLTLTSTNIPFGSTNVSATQQIVLTFSQILDPTTVNAATLKVMDTWNSNYPLAGTYAVGGNQVTFTPTSPYAPGAQIYVGECGGPTDILGEVFLNGNCYGQQLVYFTVISGTPDTTALTVTSVSPAADATGVGVNVPVSITFNKAINPNSVNSNDAVLFAGQSLVDRGSVTMSADGRTLTFNTGALSGGTNYTISLTAGGISDPSGNSLASAFTSTFATASYPATGNGSVQANSPGNNATGVPTGSLLTLYLNRQVNPATLSGNFTVTVNGSVYAGTVQATASNYEAQFTPTVPFPNGAVVQWFFSNVLDVYGDTFNGTSGTFYTVAATSANAAPQQIAVSPGTGNGEIDIEYNLPIDSTTISAGINFNGGAAATVSLAAPNVIRVVPTSTPTPGAFTYVCTNNSIKGTNGTPIQGGCYTTYFYPTSTGPDTTPGTVKLGPPNSSIGVGTNAYIRLVFSKPVDSTTINTNTVQVTSAGNPIPGGFGFVYTGSDITGVNFSPVNPLPPSSVINVSVSGLLDYAGNTFAAASTHFTTAALPDFSPASVYYDFVGNTQGIGTNAIFTCRYTKPMDPSSFTAPNVYVYDYATSAKIPVTYTFSADMMSVTLTPTSALTPNTQYNYECYNAIDLTGNAQNNNGGPYFYTGGGAVTTAPHLLYANPPNGVTNVALNDNSGPWNSTSLMLLFRGPLAENRGSITLTPQGGTPLAVSGAQEIGDTVVVVQLPAALMPNTTYTYTVTGATDYSGNPVPTATSSFTTGSGFDFNNPGVASFVPANGTTAVAVATPLTITFSEPMDPVLFDGAHVELLNHNTQAVIPTTFTFSPDYTSVSLTPTAPLTASTIYDLKVNIVNWYLTDFAGNNLNVGSAVSTFTTAP